MTTTFSRVDRELAPTPPRVFVSVLATTVLVVLATVAAPPSDAVSATVVVLVIAFLGIPHGAVDHLVVAPPKTMEPEPSAPVHRPPPDDRAWRFHLGYVAAMAAYGLVWLVSPGLALAGFLVLSVHHFGQSDLAYLRIEQRRQIAAQTSRGLFLVGVPLVAHLATVAPVVERLAGVDPTSWPWLVGHTAAWCALLVGQHIAVGLFVAPHVDGRSTVIREVVTVAALTALFVLTDPLIGFAVYFGLWHSMNHLHVLANVLGARDGSVALAPTELARLVAPRSAVSIAALAVLVVGAYMSGRPELIVPVALVFVSMLTLPHMVVVERLWQAER
jgi:Brp/Blh family beta-carotene 15,15'-monooxygenase